MHKKLGYTIVGLLAATGIFILGMSMAPRPAVAPTPASKPQATVSFLLDDGEKITGFEHQAIPLSEPTVLGLLKEVAAEHKVTLDVDTGSSMGAFVKQIGPQKNGS